MIRLESEGDAAVQVRTPGAERRLWLLLSGLAFAVRAPSLRRPLRYDEAFTYVRYVAADSPWTTWSHYEVPNNHILHSLLTRCAVAMFGNSVTGLRLTAFVAGVAIVPLTYVVARRLIGRSGGVVAACLVAGTHPLVSYSVDARGYTLQCALYLLSLDFALRLARQSGWRPVLGLSISLALALFAVPSLLFAAGTPFLLGTMQAWRSPAQRRRIVWSLCGAAALGALLTLLLYLPAMLHARRHGFHISGAPDYPESIWMYPIEVATWLGKGLPTGSGWILLSLAGVSIGNGIGRRQVPIALVLFTWPVVSVLLHAANFEQAPFPRTFLTLVPLAAIVIADGAMVLLALAYREPIRRAGAALALAAGMVLWTGAATLRAERRIAQKRDINRALLSVAQSLRIGDCLAIHSSRGEVLHAYALMDTNLHLRTLGVPAWRLQVLQRTDKDGHAPRPFAEGARAWVLVVDRTRPRDAIGWARRSGLRRPTLRASAPLDPMPPGVTAWEIVSKGK